MNVTEQLNEPYRRNDANTTHAVRSHIAARHAGVLGEFHELVAIREALRCNDASVGCRIADEIAAKLVVIRERFARGCGW